MSSAARGSRAIARPLRKCVQRTPRRFASDHAGHGHEGHHGESAFHVQQGPANESFGRGFYISLASIPLFYAIYSVASSPNDNFISRLIKNYEIGQDVETKKNVIHTTLMEQAAADRQLFASTARDSSGPPLRFPEGLNAKSPWNVSAGRDAVDLSGLAKYYKEQEQLQEGERLARRKDGKVVSIYD